MSSSIYLQCLLGMQCNDFTMIAADQINTQSIIVMKNDEEKLHEITDKLLMGVNGEGGDIAQFAQFVSKNIQLYKMRNGYELSTAASVHFTRKNLMEALKSGNPYLVNILMAGYDENDGGGQLFYLDILASCVKVPFAAHGFGGLLSLSILDNYHKPTLSESEAYEVMKLCVREVQQRLFMNLPNFQVKTISKTGIKTLPTINPATFLTVP